VTDNVKDFDIHGIVGVRLVGATPSDARAVRAQLGPTEAALTREPDIVIRYAPGPVVTSQLRLLDVGDSGFTDDAFVIGASAASPKARIAINDVGGPIEITAESGIGPIPHLVAIVNLTALANGVVPLHAAAFSVNGTGVLVTGWAKGGKTETLLGFMSNGARYIGDEWVYVDPDRDHLYGLPERIKLWEWLIEDLPDMRARLTGGDRARLRTISSVYRASRAFERVVARPRPLQNLLGRASAIVGRQRFVHSTPAALFGADKMDLAGGFEKVIWVVSHDAPDVRVEEADPLEIARRMVFSVEFEHLRFTSQYLAYRYAFPEAANTVLESAREIRLDLLTRALKDKQAFVAYHPYPAPILELYEALAPVVAS
jgi:hypothetical protein